MIDFSFCIITDNSDEACLRIIEIADSIIKLEIPNYEIIVIGGQGNKFKSSLEEFRKIDFDENNKKGWITKKKNDVANLCKYDNIVMLHDYYVFHKDWYKGFLKIKEKFNKCDLCLNPVVMIDGRRDYTDWVTYDHPTLGMHTSLPYTEDKCVRYQYFSGGYFIVKKDFFLANPLNESLVSHQEEDVEWSRRIRNKASVIFNSNSYVKHNKKHRNLGIDFWNKLGVVSD